MVISSNPDPRAHIDPKHFFPEKDIAVLPSGLGDGFVMFPKPIWARDLEEINRHMMVIFNRSALQDKKRRR